MQIGFALPQFGGQARTGGAVARFARELEAAGAHSLWVDDRLLDPLVLLAVAAGVTERVRLGTNVLVAPLYPCGHAGTAAHHRRCPERRPIDRRIRNRLVTGGVPGGRGSIP